MRSSALVDDGKRLDFVGRLESVALVFVGRVWNYPEKPDAKLL